jgi:glycosyltransferase involved in cell wall biosynthesis
MSGLPHSHWAGPERRGAANLLLAVEARFVRSPDGTVHSPPELDDGFWDRYLAVFETITVVARIGDAGEPPAGARPVPAGVVRFVAVPHYVGPVQYAGRFLGVRRAVRRAAREIAGAVIVRLPGIVGSHLARAARTVGRPYAVEMVGDPWESLSVVPGGPLFRFPLRTALALRTRRDCRRASVAAYVTRAALQRRYPPDPSALATHYSDVDLPAEAFVARPRAFSSPARELVAVGSLEVNYKGIDVLLEALRRFANGGRPRLTVVGGGRLLDTYRQSATRLGLDGDVRFAGRVPSGDGVRRELDRADLFVMPSRTEGLPRAMIEAMARGLPCIGSEVGGIPELLETSELVPAGDAGALHRALASLLTDPARLTRISTQNLERARGFAAEVLARRRTETYRTVLDRTSWRPAP